MALAGLLAPLIGKPWHVPGEVLHEYPELAEARWRVGGLPPRVAGWFLGMASVSAVTLWSYVFLSPRARLSRDLLLHELAHVRQFRRASFPILYVYETLRRGYYHNRFEVDARTFAADRLGRTSP